MGRKENFYGGTMKQFFLTLEVARREKVSENTIRRWEKVGLLKAIRVGNGTRLFSRAAIEKFEAARAAATKEKNERMKTNDTVRPSR